MYDIIIAWNWLAWYLLAYNIVKTWTNKKILLVWKNNVTIDTTMMYSNLKIDDEEIMFAKN